MRRRSAKDAKAADLGLAEKTTLRYTLIPTTAGSAYKGDGISTLPTTSCRFRRLSSGISLARSDPDVLSRMLLSTRMTQEVLHTSRIVCASPLRCICPCECTAIDRSLFVTRQRGIQVTPLSRGLCQGIASCADDSRRTGGYRQRRDAGLPKCSRLPAATLCLHYCMS